MKRKSKWYVDTDVLGWKLLSASIEIHKRANLEAKLAVGVYDTRVERATFGAYLTSESFNPSLGYDAYFQDAQEAIQAIIESAADGVKFIEPDPDKFFIGYHPTVFGEKTWLTCLGTTVVASTGSPDPDLDRLLGQVMVTFMANKTLYSAKDAQEDQRLMELHTAAWRSLKLSSLLPKKKALVLPMYSAFLLPTVKRVRIQSPGASPPVRKPALRLRRECRTMRMSC